MRFGFVVFNGLTQLDFTGPIQFINRAPNLTALTIGKTKDPITTDCGFGIVPTHSIDEVKELDAICIPGGAGIKNAISDKDTMNFIKDVAPECSYITSVCTGSLVLGAAGLLKDKEATTHWAYQHLLPMFGAKPSDERFVRDGNLFTGGGVTAGIDFAVNFIEETYSKDTAADIKLALQYDQNVLYKMTPEQQDQKKGIAAFYQSKADDMQAFLEGQMRQNNFRHTDFLDSKDKKAGGRGC